MAEGADLSAVAFIRAAVGVMHHVAGGLLLSVQLGAAGDAVCGFGVKGLRDGRTDALVLAADDGHVVNLFAVCLACMTNSMMLI